MEWAKKKISQSNFFLLSRTVSPAVWRSLAFHGLCKIPAQAVNAVWTGNSSCSHTKKRMHISFAGKQSKVKRYSEEEKKKSEGLSCCRFASKLLPPSRGQKFPEGKGGIKTRIRKADCLNSDFLQLNGSFYFFSTSWRAGNPFLCQAQLCGSTEP